MIVHRCKQYSDEWWEVRRGIATASEAKRIVTPKDWKFAAAARKYAFELIAQEYDHDYGNKQEYVTASMRNGRILEPQSRRFYEFETGCDVEEVGFVTTDDKHFGCSPDGLCGDDGGAEFKNPDPSTHVEWLWNGVVPPEHLPQVHWSLVVTGREWWDFMSHYSGLPPLLVRTYRDERTEKLAEHMETFWAMLQEMRAKIHPYTPVSGERVEAYF